MSNITSNVLNQGTLKLNNPSTSNSMSRLFQPFGGRAPGSTITGATPAGMPKPFLSTVPQGSPGLVTPLNAQGNSPKATTATPPPQTQPNAKQTSLPSQQAPVKSNQAPAPAPSPSDAAVTKGLVSPIFNTATQGLVKAPENNQVYADRAQGITNKYGGLINPLITQRAGAVASDLTSGAAAPVAQGMAAIDANAAGSIISGLTAQEQQELNANSQAITAQGQGQAGLSSAAGATAPVITAPGQTTFNPSTGSFSGQIGGIDEGTMNTYAQLLAQGAGSQIPSSIMGNAALSAQLQERAKQLNPNYNPITTPAQAAATAQNTQTAGTAATSAAQSGYSQAVQTYGPALASYQTVSEQGKTLQEVMKTTGINQNAPFLSTPINQLQSQLGSSEYRSFLAALTETQQAYESLLGAVGAATPTLNGVAATSLLSANSTPEQIDSALTQLQLAAYNKLAPMHELISTYQSQIGAGGPSSSSGTYGGYASLGD